MKTYPSNIKLKNKRKAFTFIEITICIIISALVFKVVYELMANTRKNYMYGVVNLQNLQDARLAINYLRRDFASSCPNFISPSYVTINGRNVFKDKEWEGFQNLRSQLFKVNASTLSQNGETPYHGELMVVRPTYLSFYKFVYGSTSENPKVERVTYTFKDNKLERHSKSKGKTVFTGFANVHFSLYTHSINPDIPLLWVQFTINESPNMYGKKTIGKPLELTTTIASNFVYTSQNNKYWRFQTGFEKDQ